jgi:hypothetical protein
MCQEFWAFFTHRALKTKAIKSGQETLLSSNIQLKQKARGNILWTAVRPPRPGWLSGLLATAGAYGHWVSFRNADYADNGPPRPHDGCLPDR